jgi:hypothetical protein
VKSDITANTGESYGNVANIIVEALIKGKGYTPDSATSLADRFADMVIAEHSDHRAYRELADEVNKIIHSESVPDDWDGDDSELYLLTVFLKWLPDLLRHNDAERIRAWTAGAMDAPYRRHFAELIDPFRIGTDLAGDPAWIRKSDGTTVPWNVAKVPE